ncbi:MAG TPA: Crp/Fnr family transcriptional regulator [Puia sp.]|nr:Crp/Fnr family transcriptional regulator [Puia sp.]
MANLDPDNFHTNPLRMEELFTYLESIHPFSSPLREHLSRTLKQRELTTKKFLLKAGHVCRHIWFVKKGLLRCFYITHDAEVCSWFMKEGDVIISIESFFRQTPSYETIQALEDCELFYIDYDELQRMYREFPEFNVPGRVLTEKYYCQSEQRLYSMRMQRAPERYAYLQEHEPELLQRVASKYIASYLGLTEVTFSRIKNRKMKK